MKLCVVKDGKKYALNGRMAWMLNELMKAGQKGITTKELPAGVRVSAYVKLLRDEGFNILCEIEPHGGDYRGIHGRYTLLDNLEISELDKSAKKIAARHKNKGTGRENRAYDKSEEAYGQGMGVALKLTNAVIKDLQRKNNDLRMALYVSWALLGIVGIMLIAARIVWG